jgi:radical SAM family uncharacterized protein/radical SAM-linked protein
MFCVTMNHREKFLSLLDQVSKPGRYIGGEPNMIRKDLARIKVRFALAFPEVYEIGMSHNGMRMLYHLLNGIDDVYAERAFAPWVDMGELLQTNGVPLLSLETQSPLRDFDLVGFSLQAELTYINIPYMLDLSRIPILAEDRGENDPVVCAGGPCTANPEPLADFIDFFVLGDGEEVVVEIVNVYKEARQNGLKRQQILDELARLQGIYVPSIHHPSQPWGVETRPGKPAVLVKRRWVEALSPDFYSTKPIVPVVDIIQDRVSVEVMRGCTQGCRFCQAGYWYRPTRELNVEDVMRLTSETLRNTGNREIGLLSLSTADYSQVECLTKEMARAFSKDNVSISLPSLRADMFSVSLAENVGEVKKNGFTFAPEAGSVRLRKFINKNISNEELFQAIETAYRQGWNLIKLYFMIGLPTESDPDMRELVDLIREVGKIGKKFKGGKSVNASIGTFVPKSFTPFQWDRFEDLKVLRERLNYLKATVRFPFARLKWHDPKECFIEGVLSRGDRKVGRVLLKAYHLGCRFDGWDEMFNYELWMKAFEETAIDPGFYNRDIALNEVLPWDFIDIGVSKKFLLKERQRSYEQIQTYDCKWGDCSGCGIPGNYADIKLAAIPAEVAPPLEEMSEEIQSLLPSLVRSGLRGGRQSSWTNPLESPLTKGDTRGVPAQSIFSQLQEHGDCIDRSPLEKGELQGERHSDRVGFPVTPSVYEEVDVSEQLVQLTLPRPTAAAAKVQGSSTLGTAAEKNADLAPAKPYVLHYVKEGPARFLSHLNVMRLMEQAMIRAGLRLRFTEGFNPHPKFATSPAIPLGMVSQFEYIQFEHHGELPAKAVELINACLIEGLSVRTISPFQPNGQWSITQPLEVSYRAVIDPNALNGDAAVMTEVLGRANDLINHLCDHRRGNDFWCSSKDHERIVDLWTRSEDLIEIGFTVSVNPDTGALLKPKDLLEQVLGCPPELARKFHVIKESVSFER